MIGWGTLISKAGLPTLLVAGGFIAGLAFQARVLNRPCPTLECPTVKIPACPDCNCPPTLGNEFDKIKAKKSNLTVNLHQHYSASNDSTDLRKIVRESVEQALKDYSVKKKR